MNRTREHEIFVNMPIKPRCRCQPKIMAPTHPSYTIVHEGDGGNLFWSTGCQIISAQAKFCLLPLFVNSFIENYSLFHYFSIVWLLLLNGGRIEQWQTKTVCSPTNLKYLLSDSLQKNNRQPFVSNAIRAGEDKEMSRLYYWKQIRKNPSVFQEHRKAINRPKFYHIFFLTSQHSCTYCFLFGH